MRPLDPAAARTLGLQARRALRAGDRAERSRRIVTRLLGLPELAGARRVAGYVAMADEVDVWGLWAGLAGRGTSVVLPRLCGGAEATLEFVDWSPSAPMAANRFGIPEPAGPATALDEIDVVLLPCAAVDDHGTRVGMGKGYYDRTLAGVGAGGPALVGVAFDDQRMARIAANPWDVPLGVVVTEDLVLRPSGAG